MEIVNAPAKNPWKTMFAFGLLVLLTGISLLIWPFFTASWMLAVLFGVALISAGASLTFQFNTGMAGRIVGVLLVLAGVLAIVFNQITASTLVMVLGSIVIGVGVISLLVVLIVARGASGSFIVLPILVIVAGIFPMIWPEAALIMLALFTGFFVTTWGVFLISMSLKMRKSEPRHITITQTF